MTRSNYFSIHSHSEFSVLDGMGTVEAMVAKAAANNMPGLALTDHGTMAGVLRLYKECSKAGIAAFPGSELYVVTDVNDPVAKNERYHMGMVALDYEGFQAMTRLSSRSFLRDRFHRKPLVDFGDLAGMAESGVTEHVAVTTGCYFGIVQQALVNLGYEQAKKITQMLGGWFPNLYVELQDHNIDHPGDITDDDITDSLITLADELGLPMVLGQDSHYCDESEQHVHDLMKDICYFGDGEDNKFPGGPYHLATADELRKNWSPRIWKRIEEGHDSLLDMNRLTMPALDKYQFKVPKVAKQPDKVLRSKCYKGLEGIPLYDLPPVYDTRIEYELDVIKQMGMADYFLLVQEVTDWCRDNHVIVNARGSANGSMVAYLLGITNVDPIQWGTSFDRFLSLDRKKPPDVDLDIESRSRVRVIDHLRKKFPTLVGIGTYSRIGITEEVDEFGDGDDKGSVFVQYMAAMRRKQGAAFTGQVAPKHRRALQRLAESNVRKSLGAHAGGYVLPTVDHPIDAYLATALIPSSNAVVTQAVMEDVEDAGYVKLDLLGLRSLETVSDAAITLGHDPNDWDWLPWDDKAACKLLTSGRTDGIFQFEGYATRKGGQEMKIKKTLDSILCMALYRPALMAGGQKDTYLGNRGITKGNRDYALHEFFDQWLDVTDGVFIFQEQVMEACRGVGLPYDEWNDLMKAVKASNDKIEQYAAASMARIKPIFIQCCEANGMEEEDGEDAWEAIVGFTDYGFNRAHATSYGIMAYRSAYLKQHHPLEYMNSLLSAWAGTKKEPMYIQEARRMGLHIGRPNINTSGVVWAIDPKAPNTLRKGFTTIKGVGVAAAETIVANRPAGGWQTMDEFVDSVPAGKVSGGKEWKRCGEPNGVIEKLQSAGALTILGLDP